MNNSIITLTGKGKAISDIEVLLQLRLCLPGEEMMPNGVCQVCSEGTYLLEAPIDTQLCKPCPSSGYAECLGGN